jgi:predicted transposase YbfD/YdcC
MERHVLEKFFHMIDDPRSYKNQKHPFQTLIGVSFLAILSGIDSFNGMAEFTEAKFEELSSLFEFPAGVPSHDTFARLWDNISHEQFYQSFELFLDFLKETADRPTTIINIDGKTIRNSSLGHGLHLVSAWCQANQLVLAQEKVHDKSNEITAIPLLLDKIDVQDKIITIDAMGTQRKICQDIVLRSGDYVVSLKGNQQSLFKDVQAYFEGLSDPDEILENCREKNKGHGRIEERHAFVLRDVAFLQKEHQWPGLKSVIMIQSTRTRKDKKSTETRYYISSLTTRTAREFNDIVRAHWSIENQLHWRLDCSFNEDKACITNENGAENIALMRRWAINALSQIKDKKDTTKGLMRKNLMSFKYLISTVNSIFHA